MEICDQQVGGRHKYGNSREQSLTLWNTVQQYTEQDPLGTDRNLLDIIADRDAAIMEIRDQQVGGRRKYGNFSWNTVQQYNEQDLLGIDRNYILDIIAERDAAIKERNQAFLEKKKAFEERRVAIAQRNLAIQECNVAVLERNNAVISLQQATIPEPIYCAVQTPTNRPTCNLRNQAKANSSYFKSEGMEILDALCKTMVASECPTVRSPRKRKHTGKMNFHAIIPVPGCSCTGIFRRCYKWGCGGWQSSCCTSTISAFPLPIMPHKRYRRICGRKMSASVFSKLLSRLAVEGYDFSRPVDLKEHWSKHGTNLYTRIK